MDDITRDFTAAVQYEKNGQLDEAEALYANILHRDNFHIESIINLGGIYKTRGNLDKAIQLYKQALSIQSYNLTANSQLALALRLQGYIDEAVKYYKRALAIDPFAANLLSDLANTLLQVEQTDEAIFFFKHALKVKPNSIEYRLKLGNVLMNIGEYEAASDYFKQAATLAPNTVYAYNGMGTVFLRQNRLNEALASFSKVLEINPNNSAAKQWFSFVQRLASGLNEVTFNYQGIPIKFWLTGKNLPVELPHAKGEFSELAELEFVRQNLKPQSVIVDIGCNVGNHLVYFAKVMKVAKIIPFEIHPQVIEILKKNISLNEIAATIDLSKLGLAIGRNRGKASLREHPVKDFCLTSVYETESGEIDIFPLDDVITESVDLIKIDVESIEIEVLEGARRIVSEFRPDLFVEVRKSNEAQFLTFLETFGYVVAKKFDWGSYANFYAKPGEVRQR